MTKYSVILITFLALIFCQQTYAQLPGQIELDCPAGSSSTQFGTTYNNSTGKYRRLICVDSTGNLSFNSGTQGNLAIKPFSSDAIQYVSTNGNDSNDGLSMGTAKSCNSSGLNAAHNALPTVTINSVVYHVGIINATACQTGTISSTVSLSVLASLQGLNSSSTVWNCTSLTTDCIQWADRSSPYNNLHGSGTLKGFTLIGPGANTQPIAGIHTGDEQASRIEDVKVDNFTGTNGACFWFDNQTGWYERNQLLHVEAGVHDTASGIVQNGCTKEYRFTTAGGLTNSFYDTQFYGVHYTAGSGQTVFSNEAGTMYKGFVHGNGNVSGGATIWTVSGSADLANTFIDLGAECTNCSSNATGWNISSTNWVGSHLGPGIVTGDDSHILHTGYYTNGGAQADYNGSLWNLAALQGGTGLHNGVGTWLHAGGSGVDGFYNCLGLNIHFNGANWITQGDGVSNGAAMICSAYGGTPGLRIYSVPNIGGTKQTISTATLDSTYLRATLDGVNGWVLNTGTASPVSTKSSAYTLTASDSWINVTGTTTITIPHALIGQRWDMFNSGIGTVTLQTDSGNINGAANITLAANTGKSVTCDGTNCFAH